MIDLMIAINELIEPYKEIVYAAGVPACIILFFVVVFWSAD